MMEMDLVNDERQQIRIILVGTPGSGKSRIGNNILGSNKHFKYGSRTLAPTANSTVQDGKEITIVDTTNSYTGRVSERDIGKAIEMISPGPHVFLFCVKMDRFTDETIKTIKSYENILGIDMYQYTIFVFTHVDQWQSDMEEQGVHNSHFEEYIKGLPSEMIQLMNLCDDRYCSFNNRKTGSEMKKQRENLFSKIESLVKRNTNNPYKMSFIHGTDSWVVWAWDWTFGWMYDIVTHIIDI